MITKSINEQSLVIHSRKEKRSWSLRLWHFWLLETSWKTFWSVADGGAFLLQHSQAYNINLLIKFTQHFTAVNWTNVCSELIFMHRLSVGYLFNVSITKRIINLRPDKNEVKNEVLGWMGNEANYLQLVNKVQTWQTVWQHRTRVRIMCAISLTTQLFRKKCFRSTTV